jgi:hypothetical protein
VTVKAVSPTGNVWHFKLLDDGAHDDGDPNDGEYARQFTHTPEAGTYEFTFRARGFSLDGEPVTREAVRAKYVEGRFPVKPDSSRPGNDIKECCERIMHFLGSLMHGAMESGE